MDEEIKELFKYSQPENVRNSRNASDELYYWIDLGLGQFSNMDLDGKVPEIESPSKSTTSTSSNDQKSPTPFYLVSILRLTVDSPFPDLKSKALRVLQLLEEQGHRVPRTTQESSEPSSFISISDCPTIEIERASMSSDHMSMHVMRSPGDSGETLDQKKGRLLSEAFFQNGRVDHSIQLMAYHPDYLECFLKAQNFLMKGDGPLNFPYRHYIAIMAAARYHCVYLIELQKREFLYQGGDPKWLRGIEFAPAKLASLYNINKLMAHRPWILKKEDFLHLTKKAGWSLSEVVHAIVLLSHFHSLSSFINSCGITCEIDFDRGHSYHHNDIEGAGLGGVEIADSEKDLLLLEDLNTINNTNNSPKKTSSSIGSSSSSSIINSKTDNVHQQNQMTGGHQKSTNICSTGNSSSGLTMTASSTLKHHNSIRTSDNNIKNGSGAPGGRTGSSSSAKSTSPKRVSTLPTITEKSIETILATMKNLSETTPIEDPEEQKKRFETVASDDTNEKENRSMINSTSNLPSEVVPFLIDSDFNYEDFAKRGQVNEMHTFRIQDYSWEEHGYSLVNRLYTDIGGILDDKFTVAKNLTYYTMGGRNHVDTTKFRVAIWNYIHCLYGIRWDDYDYAEINQLLERPMKSYIKTVTCFPERITKDDYFSVMKEFKHSEKIHVNLMIMEAKIQAELLYSLRTINYLITMR